MASKKKPARFIASELAVASTDVAEQGTRFPVAVVSVGDRDVVIGHHVVSSLVDGVVGPALPVAAQGFTSRAFAAADGRTVVASGRFFAVVAGNFSSAASHAVVVDDAEVQQQLEVVAVCGEAALLAGAGVVVRAGFDGEVRQLDLRAHVVDPDRPELHLLGYRCWPRGEGVVVLDGAGAQARVTRVDAALTTTTLPAIDADAASMTGFGRPGWAATRAVVAGDVIAMPSEGTAIAVWVGDDAHGLASPIKIRELAVGDGCVVVVDSNARLACVDFDGTVRWQCVLPDGGVNHLLALRRHVVTVGDKGAVFFVDTKTGALVSSAQVPLTKAEAIRDVVAANDGVIVVPRRHGAAPVKAFFVDVEGVEPLGHTDVGGAGLDARGALLTWAPGPVGGAHGVVKRWLPGPT